jgi:hypothetical protein
MTALIPEKQYASEYNANGKVNYLLTGGGKITCLRCQAKSTRTKMQCGRPALTISSKQLCQYHGGRPHAMETLKRISEANTIHGRSTKAAKEQYRHDSALMHELEDAIAVLKMGEGPRIRGRKPRGYKPVMTQADVVRMIQERLLHIV